MLKKTKILCVISICHAILHRVITHVTLSIRRFDYRKDAILLSEYLEGGYSGNSIKSLLIFQQD